MRFWSGLFRCGGVAPKVDGADAERMTTYVRAGSYRRCELAIVLCFSFILFLYLSLLSLSKAREDP